MKIPVLVVLTIEPRQSINVYISIAIRMNQIFKCRPIVNFTVILIVLKYSDLHHALYFIHQHFFLGGESIILTRNSIL